MSGSYPAARESALPRVTDTRRSRVPLPWIETGPVTDLRLALLCLPLWWVLGLEQAIWAPIGAIALAKVLAAKGGRLRMPSFAVWLVLFLMVHLASGAFIVEPMRVITFARTFGAYVGATLWVLVLVNTVHTLRDGRKVLAATAAAMTVAGILGLLGITGTWRGQIVSPVGLLLPSSITSTTYGGQIAIRSTGGMSWFVGLGDYYRVDSVFLFPTLFATAIAVTLPIVIWLAGSALSRRARYAWLFSASVLGVNLLFTTGRIAIASLMAGAAWFSIAKRPLRAALAVVSIVVLVSGLLTRQDVSGFAALSVEAAAYARGSGSVENRSRVYRSTMSGFLDRPILGWGTERDVPDQLYPAGSHSTYLGFLYKHGLLGFACFMGVLVSSWIATRPGGKIGETSEGSLLRFGRWTLVVVLVNGSTDVLDLDATTLMLIFVILGTMVSIRQQERPSAVGPS